MAELNVSKKSIATLLTEMKGRKFIVPEYQRPYRWERQECETLWRDLTDFFDEGLGESGAGDEYYLGTIVTSQEEQRGRGAGVEVIDGQQRLTSLLLLLRAFYHKLEGMKADDKNVVGLKAKIAPCIWDVDRISGVVTDKGRIRIESRVATERDNEALHAILRNGIPDESAKDLYSLNYAYFLEQCGKFAAVRPMHWEALCVTILENCIILPIECANLEVALRIFTTLNNRGMPLADSDIFKAKMYASKKGDDRDAFTEAWKDLVETVVEAKLTMDDLFRFYSHVVRARDGETGKEIALRKFYAGDNGRYDKLAKIEVMGELRKLADRWRDLRTWADGPWTCHEAGKWIHCLEWYPNEYWRYVVSVYFFRPGGEERLAEEFPALLRMLTAWLYGKFVVEPTVNAIKLPCFNLMKSLIEGKQIASPEPVAGNVATYIERAHSSRVAGGLLLLHAYLNENQREFVPDEPHIEHILPRRWQSANYNGWSKKDAGEHLERFGNKVVFEKRLNIQAGNNYFGQKKERYARSVIADVQFLASYPKNDWGKDDIDTRDRKFVERISSFLRSTP